ncbi:hypothetical protein NDU88_009678 [Pleurodeles waltl]|uniref:Uncharacterized protein n=1 Tax=Pleurodeles waltl TaxID=8319 RepID=A0AAV7RZ08_PLEWA|nr:hypothetical protein NDU88_009678 [Pleurodeles waltl]
MSALTSYFPEIKIHSIISSCELIRRDVLEIQEEAGVSKLVALLRDGAILPFDQLQTENVRHFLYHGVLVAEFGRLRHITDPEPEQHPLVHTLHTMGSGLRLLIWLNRVVAHTTQDSLLPAQWCSERDLGRAKTSKEWNRAFYYLCKVSRKATLQYIQHNILHKHTSHRKAYTKCLALPSCAVSGRHRTPT